MEIHWYYIRNNVLYNTNKQTMSSIILLNKLGSCVLPEMPVEPVNLIN
eukprot:UN03205